MNAVCCLVGSSFGIASRPCPWRFQVQCFSRYWELILRNGHRLGGTGTPPQEGGKLAILLRSA